MTEFVSNFMLSHIVLPTLISVLGHVSLCFMLLTKWELMEQTFADGDPIPFANMSTYVGRDCGPSWWAVFSPSWTADVIVVIVTGLALTNLQASINARLMHYTSLAQTCAHAAFKVLLVRRFLADRHESWFVTFSPLCEAAAASNPPAPRCTPLAPSARSQTLAHVRAGSGTQTWASSCSWSCTSGSSPTRAASGPASP